jgi:hypothetical protein
MAKIKKIKLGTTTYDLCDADAVHTVKQDGVTGATVNRFGTCTTGAGTAAKTVSITTGTFGLETGAKVTVKFSNKNTASTPTLNVNSTGAKNIYHNGAQITSGNNKGMLNGTVEFVYDGTQWQLIGNYVDTNSSHAIISGLKKDGETNIQGSSSSGNITLGDSGVSAGYYGPESTDNPASEGSIVVPEIAVNSKGVVVDATNRTLTLPSVTITNKPSTDGTDTVYAVTNLVEKGTNGHEIEATYTGLPTKAYVDKIATGHVKYLGTVSALSGLSTTAGQGDFYRVSTAFTFGSETAHLGDIILAVKDNPGQNTTDWDLIHAEVNTNTWTANTKANAGYVAAGTGQAYKVWHTDADGNPAWRTLGEANLAWGGKNFAGGWGPIDAAMIPQFAANRFAFLPASAITSEYSTDGGSTWTATTASNARENIFATTGGFYIGNNSATGIDKSKYKCRITITTTGAVYSTLNKFAIRVSTNGSTGSHVKLESRTKANQDAGNNTWVTNVERAELSGWSGWNVINVSGITTHGNTSAQYSQLRFTFGVDSHPSTSQYNGLQILSIMAFGGEGWTTPSTMASNGHLYSYDATKKATFPGDVTVTSGKKFIGNLQGTASAASTVTQNVVAACAEHNLLLSTSNSTSTETGNINKANNLSFYPSASGTSSKGVLVVGSHFDTSANHGDVDSGELHVYGNIYAGAGTDGFGVYPEQDNYSELGGEWERYWCKTHSSQVYANEFYYKDDMMSDDSEAMPLSSKFALSGHTHTTSLASNTGTSSITLSHGGKYKLTAGGTSVIFTMPGSGNTDTKVNTTLGTTTKAYILGTSTTPTSTAQAVTTVADTGVYLDTTAGQLTATTFKGALKGNADTATNVAWTGVTSKPSYYDAKAITSISRSGTTFTATYLDGTTTTFTQQDNNSDTKVTQAAAITTNGSYPLLLGYDTGTTAVTNTVNKTSTLKYNPSTQILSAPTFSGTLNGTASRADAVVVTGTSCTSQDELYDVVLAPVMDTETYVTPKKDSNIKFNASASDFYDPATNKYFTGGSTLLIGAKSHIDCWDNDGGYFDNSYAGTGHLEVTGNLIVGGGSDEYGIFPAQSNFSTIGSPEHYWYNIYAANIYQGGTRVLTSHQTIKQDGITGATVNRFGTCSTAAATAAKTVSITSGTYSLAAGLRVTVKFTYANTASTPTLNVNSKGAKNIFHKGAQITSGANKALLAGVCDFVYDGTQWHLVGNYIDTNTDAEDGKLKIGSTYYTAQTTTSTTHTGTANYITFII